MDIFRTSLVSSIALKSHFFLQGTQKDSIKKSIEFFNSTKKSEMKALSLKINELKKQLSEKIQFCHERSKYEKELVRETAKALFKIGKARYEEVLDINDSSSMYQSKGFILKHGEDDLGYQKCLVSGSYAVDNNEIPGLNSNMEDIIEPDTLPYKYDNLSSNIRKYR